MTESATDRFRLEDLAVQPGIYINPQTEVAIIVDDSVAIDPEGLAETDEEEAWIRISDEAPVDEQRRDELLDEFKSRRERAPGDEDFDEIDELEPDPEED